MGGVYRRRFDALAKPGGWKRKIAANDVSAPCPPAKMVARRQEDPAYGKAPKRRICAIHYPCRGWQTGANHGERRPVARSRRLVARSAVSRGWPVIDDER